MFLDEKLEPVYIFIAIILGLLVSNVNFLVNISNTLLTVFLSLMLFALFLEVPLNDIKNSFSNFKYTSISLVINFIWTPLFAYFLGSLFLKGNIDLFIGFCMLMLTPCTDWYLLFTKIAKGNVSLNISILPINLILQLILLPIYLLIFFSASNFINILDLAYSLIVFIFIPFVFAQIFKSLDFKFIIKFKTFVSSFQMVFLACAIFFLFVFEGSNLFANLDSLWILFVPILLFFIVNFLLDFLVSKIFKFGYKEYASLTLTTLARNSPLALAIAVKSFPGNFLIPIALVIGPLIELPVLYIISKSLLSIRKHY